MGDQVDNIKVCVRVRPENEAERSSAQLPVVGVVDESVLVFDPPQEEMDRFYRGKVVSRNRDPTAKKARDQNFAFDRVFAPNTTNIEVYEHTTKSVLRSLLNGYNCSVFAYGATGAGKTFSMLGNSQTPGVIFLTMMDLYNIKESEQDDKTIDVGISYLEVYNEEVKDLLVQSNNSLPVRENSARGVIVQGLSIKEPESAEELLKILEMGNQNRTQHPTDANSESSRSHAVFQVFVKITSRMADIKENSIQAKLALIDLAGSERATVTKNKGARLREGANINRSLLALGNCINALADTKRKGLKHIPYRNSKLTRILKDSLGGNCKTVMIAAVSPSRASYEDTYNTLKYADRAKHIRAVVKKNTFSMNVHVQKYAKVVEDLHGEIAQLKEKLRTETEKASLVSTAVLPYMDATMLTAIDVNEIQDLFCERKRIRADIMHIESMQKLAQFTAFRKERVLVRLGALSGPQQAGPRTCDKVKRAIGSAQSRENTLEKTKIDEVKSWIENTAALQEKYRSLSEVAKTTGEHTKKVFDLQMKCEHLELELLDMHKENKHLEKIINAQENDCSNNERIVNLLLSFVTQQHEVLQQFGLAEKLLGEKYREIKNIITNDRHVSFTGNEQCVLPDIAKLFPMMQLPVLSSKQHEAEITGVSELKQSADATFVAEAVEETFTISSSLCLSYAEVTASVPNSASLSVQSSPTLTSNEKMFSSKEAKLALSATSLHGTLNTETNKSYTAAVDETFTIPSSPCLSYAEVTASVPNSASLSVRSSPTLISNEKKFSSKKAKLASSATPPRGTSNTEINKSLSVQQASTSAEQTTYPYYENSTSTIMPVRSFSQCLKELGQSFKSSEESKNFTSVEVNDEECDEAKPAKLRKIDISPTNSMNNILATNSNSVKAEQHIRNSPLATNLPRTPDIASAVNHSTVNSTSIITEQHNREPMDIQFNSNALDSGETDPADVTITLISAPTTQQPQHVVLPLISQGFIPTIQCATPPLLKLTTGPSFADVVKSPVALQSVDKNSKQSTVTKSKPGYLKMTTAANQKRLHFESSSEKENS